MPQIDKTLHKKPTSEILACPVSTLSVWNDAVWRFPTQTAGYAPVSMNWNVVMGDDSSLLDPQWSELLALSRRFFFSIVYENKRKTLGTRSLNNISVTLKYLLFWMSLRSCRDFASISFDKAKMYVEDVVDVKILHDGDAISTKTLSTYVDLLVRVYEQAPALRDVPGAVMIEHPFAGLPARQVAKKHFRSESKRIPPVPDELFLPVMSTAIDWLGEPARDILAATRCYFVIRANIDLVPQEDRRAWKREIRFLDDRLVSFYDPAAPWLSNLQGDWDQEQSNRIDKPLPDLLRRLVYDLVGACLIVLQGLSGLRVSEICGLEAWPRRGDNTPYCLETRLSLSGLEEIFVIRGRLFKTTGESREIEWVAGGRPIGSDYIPLPVRAIHILHSLFAPWVSETSPRLINWMGYVGVQHDAPQNMMVDHVDDLQNRFIKKYANVPESFADYHISTHQWRKSFALFVVRSDERLLAAVADHFKHLSIVVTEEAYLGTDIELLGVMRDILLSDAVRVLEGIIFGKEHFAGKMTDIIRANMDRIKAALPDDALDKKREELRNILIDEKVSVFGAEWGGCYFRAETARCHYEVEGKFQLSAGRPAYIGRRADLCCDCSNLMVGMQHLPFWQTRHDQNLRIYKQSVAAGDMTTARVAKSRVDTAASILIRLKSAA